MTNTWSTKEVMFNRLQYVPGLMTTEGFTPKERIYICLVNAILFKPMEQRLSNPMSQDSRLYLKKSK